MGKLFYQSFSSGGESKEDVNNSADSNRSELIRFEKDHRFSTIFQPMIEKDKLVISVTDTGIGIKKKDIIKLFQLFGTLKNTSQMNTQGIGLGLVISENIVQAFEGAIGVKSKYGKGTKFAFSIILGKDENEDKQDILNAPVNL